jgi:hypothetical protein
MLSSERGGEGRDPHHCNSGLGIEFVPPQRSARQTKTVRSSTRRH